MTEPAAEFTHDIFISYKRDDEARIARLAAALGEAGYAFGGIGS